MTSAGLTQPESGPVDSEKNGERMNSAELGERIDQLRQMTTAELRVKYHELFGQTSHSNHKGYLFRRLAWRLQSLAEGGLSERARQYAREITQDADLRLVAPRRVVSSQSVAAVANPFRQVDPRIPAAGTQLIKRYKDETITVMVLDEGFRHAETSVQVAQRHRSRGDRDPVERVFVLWLEFA